LLIGQPINAYALIIKSKFTIGQPQISMIDLIIIKDIEILIFLQLRFDSTLTQFGNACHCRSSA
jgi:hypothetical protein